MALSDLKCRTARAAAKLQKFSDGGGLQLWVQPNGGRLWRLAYRFGGKQKLLALGAYTTSFTLPSALAEDQRPPIQQVYAALAADEARNDLIFDDVLSTLEERRSPVIPTERKDHALVLSERLARFARNVILLTGGMGVRQRQAVTRRLADIPPEEERVLVATGRYIGEGFDDARLDTLFLAMPISWKGTLAQYVGRLYRLHPGKREVVVYDYVDEAVPVLARMSEKRIKGYRSLGYSLGAKGETAEARWLE